MEPADVSPDAVPAQAPRAEQPRQEQPRHEQPRQEQPRQEQKHKPRAENRQGQSHGQGQRDRHQPQRPVAVDKSELPAFLFRPVPVRKPEPQTD